MKDLANQIQSSQFKNSWLKTYNFTLPLSFNLALVHQEDVFKKAKNRPSNDLAAAKDSSKKSPSMTSSIHNIESLKKSIMLNFLFRSFLSDIL